VHTLVAVEYVLIVVLHGVGLISVEEGQWHLGYFAKARDLTAKEHCQQGGDNSRGDSLLMWEMFKI